MELVENERFLVLLCGLPGTGKSTAREKLVRELEGYHAIDLNEIRRRHGMRRMPKTQDAILRELDRQAAMHLNHNEGVIIDGVNRYSFRRHQLYGVASCCNRRVITLETICSEELAKKRMRERPKGDGLLSDPNDPAVYDRLKCQWEDIVIDFKYPGEDHVAYVQFDSEKNVLRKIIIRNGMHGFIGRLGRMLES